MANPAGAELVAWWQLDEGSGTSFRGQDQFWPENTDFFHTYSMSDANVRLGHCREDLEGCCGSATLTLFVFCSSALPSYHNQRSVSVAVFEATEYQSHVQVSIWLSLGLKQTALPQPMNRLT